MVRETGIEPVCPRGRRILSPVRLPIPPLPHGGRHFTIGAMDWQESIFSPTKKVKEIDKGEPPGEHEKGAGCVDPAPSNHQSMWKGCFNDEAANALGGSTDSIDHYFQNKRDALCHKTSLEFCEIPRLGLRDTFAQLRPVSFQGRDYNHGFHVGHNGLLP